MNNRTPPNTGLTTTELAICQAAGISAQDYLAAKAPARSSTLSVGELAICHATGVTQESFRAAQSDATTTAATTERDICAVTGISPQAFRAAAVGHAVADGSEAVAACSAGNVAVFCASMSVEAATRHFYG